MESISLIVGIVIVLAFGALILAFATRKRNPKKGKQKSRAQIIRDSNRKLSADPHNPDGLIPLGDLYFNEQAWDKAYPLYETMMSIAPAHKEIDPFTAALRQGICALKLNKLPECFKGLGAAYTINSQSFDVNYYIGLACYKNNEFDKGVPCMKKAIMLRPEAPGLTTMLGLALYKGKHYKECLSYLKKGLDENPENKEVLYAMADAMNESGYGDKAMKVFMHLRADPEFGANSCLAAGLNHFRAGQVDKALQDFEIGLKHQNVPQDIAIELRYRYANACFSMKQISRGLTALNEIQSMSPNYKDVPQLIARYQELSQNKNLQTYLMSSSSDYVSLCRRIVSVYYQKKAFTKILDIGVNPDCVEVTLNVEFPRSEEVHIFRFYRTTGSTGELYVRDFHSKIMESKVDKGVCFTAGVFSEEARRYVEGRPIDLVEKEALIKLLKKVDMA